MHNPQPNHASPFFAALTAPVAASKAATQRDALDLRWSRLMAVAQAGDRGAYAILLRECLPWLRGICRSRLRDPTDVEDAVQDALLTLHTIRHTYDAARPFRPWLRAVAERRAIDRGRRRSRRSAHEVGFEAAESVADTGAGPEAQLLHQLASERLRRVTADLPPAQRTALQLAKIEGLSLAEASARSGMSVGALKVATHRALNALRQRFGIED